MYYLEALDIVKSYEKHTALNGVNLRVPPGCIYGLLGPNGAGKSTLIRIINRIISQDEGIVRFNGRESVQNDVYNIGYLPEERGLYKKMKVGEHVIFLARLKGLSKSVAQEKCKYWLQKFDVESWKDKKIEELSKGMQQKIQFIASVIHEPDLYIFDEPFSGFDPINTELLKNEILELKAQGKTIILSTHNMESVEELCDEISLIHQSKVILEGNVKEIRERLRPNIFNIEIAGNTFEQSSNFYEILSLEKSEESSRLRIKKDEQTSSSKLIQEIASSYEVMSFEEELPTMHNIFIQLVSKKES